MMSALGGAQMLLAVQIHDVLLAVVAAMCGLLTVVVGVFMTHYLGHISKQDNNHVTRDECSAFHASTFSKIDAKYELLNQKIDLLLGPKAKEIDNAGNS